MKLQLSFFLNSYLTFYFSNVYSVDSNDALYGSDPKFIAEVNKICSTLIDEILAHLKYLGERGVSSIYVFIYFILFGRF